MAAKIRMLDLGYKEAEGVLTYVDDRYIKNYSFNADSKENNQTFCIGLQDSRWLYFTNENFRRLIDTGNFVYVDGHYVIDDPKYIRVTENDELDLTDYAKQNIDECCLRFDIELYKISSVKYDEYADRVMFRKAKAVDCRTVFNSDNHNMAVFERSEDLKRFYAALIDEATHISEDYKTFCELAWSHIERCHCAYKETFRERTLLSDKMFDRIKRKEAEKPELETVLALCFGLNLTHTQSTRLLLSAGYDISQAQNPNMVVYRMMLAEHSIRSIFEANEVLVALNFEPLCKKEYYDMLETKK